MDSEGEEKRKWDHFERGGVEFVWSGERIQELPNGEPFLYFSFSMPPTCTHIYPSQKAFSISSFQLFILKLHTITRENISL
jgi:hypothetical protein